MSPHLPAPSLQRMVNNTPTLPVEDTLYHPGRRRWPETTRYAYRDGCHQLLLFRRNPSEQEIQRVRTSQLDFSLETRAEVTFLFYRFEAEQAWSYVPVSWWPQRKHDEVAPPISSKPAPLQLLLIDSWTGSLRVARSLELSGKLTRQLHTALRYQAERRLDSPAKNEPEQAFHTIAGQSEAA